MGNTSKFTAKSLLAKLKSSKISLDITTLDEYEELDIENGTMDTKSASMNSIISGSPKGGVPIGRITGFYGGSGCGKSFIIGATVASFQENGYVPIIVDTENAWHSNASGSGIDPEGCLKVEGRIIEQVKFDIVKIVKGLDAEIKDGLKLVVAIDSIAGLRSIKEVKDVDADNAATDMGQRAKAIRSLFSTLNDELGQRNITFLWTNHRMQDPSQTFRSSIEKMPGGEAIIYYSDVIIGMKRVEVANTDSGKDSTSRNMGAEIRIEAVKQRFVAPFMRSNMYIGYKGGMERYHGLWDMAREYGVITGNRSYTLSDDTKIGYRKDAEYNNELWETKIIPLLDPVIRQKFRFGDDT
jgi:RecA/RadA recombinase